MLNAYARIASVVAFAALTAPSRMAYAQPALVTWKATEQWRVDGTQGGQAFGNVRDIAIGQDGTLWVLDYTDQTFRRFDASGKPLPSVGRRGQGPGEMSKANGMVVLRDGSVWVNDPVNKRMTVFDATGTFSRQYLAFSGGYGFRWDGWIDRKTGDVIDKAMIRRPGATRYAMEFQRFTVNGVIRDTVAIPTCSPGVGTPWMAYKGESRNSNTVSAYPFTTGGGTAADGMGAVWCAEPASRRAALVRIGKHDTIAQTSLTLAPIPVDQRERDIEIGSARARVSKYATNDFDASKIPSMKPPIASLTVDDDDQLWVQHTDRMHDRTTTFDVHDATGKHRRAVGDIPTRTTYTIARTPARHS